ncbi:MAG TPA: hypothetical protein VME17_13605, partial [Bryobacteraceae bacterium]|nr:hypothetical protein [Bryobacteraceae bacterium]
FVKAAVIGPQLNSSKFVAIQIHEFDLPFLEMRFQTRSMHNEFGVALMSWTLAYDNPTGAETKEASRGRSDKHGVRVYQLWQIFHQIWFEENCFAKHLQMEKPQSGHEKRLNLLGVFDRIQDCYK